MPALRQMYLDFCKHLKAVVILISEQEIRDQKLFCRNHYIRQVFTTKYADIYNYMIMEIQYVLIKSYPACGISVEHF